MPADSGAGAVFGDQNVLERIRAEPRERRSPRSQRQQKRWHIVSALQLALVEIVSPAKRDHAPPAGEAVKLEFLERQRLNLAHELPFLVQRDQFGLILEPRWQYRTIFKQAELVERAHLSIRGR